VNSSTRVQTIAARFSELPQVEAVVLAGSQTANLSDAYSDLDLYIYSDQQIPLADRADIARELADSSTIEINKPFWGPEDAWTDRASGLGVDLIYWSPRWIEDQVNRVLVHHQASVGYSTCFWYTVLHSEPVFDRNGWFAAFQQQVNQPYPDPLRRSVLTMNYPVLRQISSSYRHQIELAVQRQDRVSVSHRIDALLASYFDVLFAVNRVPHPGEKRLIQHASRLSKLPHDMVRLIDSLICSIGSPWEDQNSLLAADHLLDSLDELLIAENLITTEGISW
jgi:predicted nucleotidyltransferase